MSERELSQEELEAEKLQKEAEIEKRLTAAEHEAESSKALAQLVQDPNIREYLAAKEAGKEVKLVVGKVDEEEDEVESLDFDNLDPKKLQKVLIKSITQAVEARVKPLDEAVKGISQLLESRRTSEIREEISQMEKTLPDFSALKQKMAEIARSNPNLSIRDLYTLARSQASAPKQVASERPTVLGGRAAKKGEVSLPGRHGFGRSIEEAISRYEEDGLLDGLKGEET